LIDAKEDELKLLNEQLEKREVRLRDLEELGKQYNKGFPEMEKQKDTYIELLEKYKVQLTDKQQKLIGIESRIQELKSSLGSLEEQIINKENLIEVSEKRLEDIKNAIGISTNEYNEREKRLIALTEKIDHVKPEFEKLVKTKEVIEKSISDSRSIFQKLKADLETQEKEIRDKESRINRLELLSFIYRASKFFGGILIGLGIIFIIWSIAVINFGNMDNIVIFWLLIIAAGSAISSGVFHLLKS
jgi:chromosome segregation ATPase